MKRPVAVLAALLLSIGLWSGAAGDSATSASSAGLPRGFAEQLMREANIRYSHPSRVSPEVRAAVLYAVSHGASPVVPRSRPAVVQVTFTDNDARDHWRRIYVNRPAIMGIYVHAAMAFAGSVGTPEDTVNSTFVDLIDPTSFQYLLAFSFATTTHVDRLG